MSVARQLTLLAFASTLGLGCEGGDGSAAKVSGQLALAEYPGLSAPALVAQAEDGSYATASVDADGHFVIKLAGDGSYRFSVARVAQDGTLVIVTRIRLDAGSYWGHVASGGRVDLGTIRPEDRGHSYGSYDDYYGGHEREHERDGGVACVPHSGRADLPYDVKLEIGDTFRLSDAFLEKGPRPAAIVSVTMEDGAWRLPTLRADQPFTVDAADCAHAGNRDTGRDRVFVTWQNADGSRETDHLDVRYCEAASGGSGSGSSGSGSGKDRGGEDHDDDYDTGESEQCTPPRDTPPACVPPELGVSTASQTAGVTASAVGTVKEEPACATHDDSTPPATAPASLF